MSDTSTFERKTERGILYAVGGGALLVGAAAVLFGGTQLIIDAVGDAVPLRLEVDHALPEGIGGGTATLIEGAYDSAAVSASGLSAGVVTLLTVARGFGLLTTAAVAWSVAWLAWKLLRGQPFAASVGNALVTAGGSLAIGGLLSQGLGGFGAWIAIEELLGDVSAGADPFFPLIMGFDPAPLGYGLAMMLIALAFERGRSLQQDTDGLV
ncbi:MAG: hypothetical protein ABW204_04695 [Microbacteriaceae bacterium]